MTPSQVGLCLNVLFAADVSKLAHKNLYQVAGVLHRDISLGNLLINSNGDAGDRGILIDFDNAVRIDDTSPYAQKYIVVSKRLFIQSTDDWLGSARVHIVLCPGSYYKKKGTHTYSDDLESFFYVLTWIVAVYESPGILHNPIPELASFWDHQSSHALESGYLTEPYSPRPTSDWFGEEIKALIHRLWCWFRARHDERKRPLSERDPDKDYNEYLAEIQKCVDQMETRLSWHCIRLSQRRYCTIFDVLLYWRMGWSV